MKRTFKVLFILLIVLITALAIAIAAASGMPAASCHSAAARSR